MSVRVIPRTAMVASTSGLFSAMIRASSVASSASVSSLDADVEHVWISFREENHVFDRERDANHHDTQRVGAEDDGGPVVQRPAQNTFIGVQDAGARPLQPGLRGPGLA